MITEDYVPYKVARLLQEKGFNEVCFACYEYFISGVTMYSGWQFEYKGESVRNTDERVKCPTLQMTMKWLRDVHNLHITVKPYNSPNGIVYHYEIYKLGKVTTSLLKEKSGFENNESACKDAITYSLMNLI